MQLNISTSAKGNTLLEKKCQPTNSAIFYALRRRDPWHLIRATSLLWGYCTLQQCKKTLNWEKITLVVFVKRSLPSSTECFQNAGFQPPAQLLHPSFNMDSLCATSAGNSGRQRTVGPEPHPESSFEHQLLASVLSANSHKSHARCGTHTAAFLFTPGPPLGLRPKHFTFCQLSDPPCQFQLLGLTWGPSARYVWCLEQERRYGLVDASWQGLPLKWVLLEGIFLRWVLRCQTFPQQRLTCCITWCDT